VAERRLQLFCFAALAAALAAAAAAAAFEELNHAAAGYLAGRVQQDMPHLACYHARAACRVEPFLVHARRCCAVVPSLEAPKQQSGDLPCFCLVDQPPRWQHEVRLRQYQCA